MIVADREKRMAALLERIEKARGVVLTVRDVVVLSKRGPTKIYEEVAAGKLVGTRLSAGGPLRFTSVAVAEWLLAGERYSLAGSAA